MEVEVYIGSQPTTLVIPIQTAQEHRIGIKVKSTEHPNTLFVDRYKTIFGSIEIEVGMPIAPEKVIVEVFNQGEGLVPMRGGFKVGQILQKPLQALPQCINYNNQKIASAIPFFSQFSAIAGYSDAGGKVYYDQSFEYVIKYLDSIPEAPETPARIHAEKGFIEVSAEYFRSYTIPMRMAVLLHEFAHYWLNRDIDSEIEADLNGLALYLSLGYPRISAFNSFTRVFMNAPTKANKERMEIIKTFISNFDEGNPPSFGEPLAALSPQCQKRLQ
ncbi:MAG: hypothetical protein CMI29_11150 [Opitutae bacterium]|nr:hypothetical protein [Opitutae bacterium]|tara:strand:+ start:12953 stop:13771 length:819 start_codon:yes stop_codon:yes gene_type:complete